MKKTSRKNQRGSVLLAVVCMSMMCMTLVTIALSVVSYTTKASSRNVQRTQAKITAEKALTEFVDSYAGSYESIGTLASVDRVTAESNKISVKMNSDPDGDGVYSEDADFSQDYGTCDLLVYNYDKGFKVEAVCTFSTQTQTASIYFEEVANNPYTPANTLEASNGALTDQGYATPVDGNLYIEKDTTTSANYVFFYNGAEYQSHIYSEMNLYIGGGAAKVMDLTNKTYSSNYAPNNGTFFQQAPTIMTEGYVTSYNTVYVKTDVGKTDTSGRNSDDSGYDESNLSNKDGFILARKKFIFTYPDSGIGSRNGTTYRPIDVYCSGAFFGPIPDSITSDTGTTDITAEKQEIREAFTNKSGAIGNGVDGGQARPATIYGNFYSYKTGGNSSQNGDVVINMENQKITIDGDMFVRGDIYFTGSTANNSTTNLEVTGTLYLEGKVYDNQGNVATVELDGSDYVLKWSNGTTNTVRLKANKYSPTIDTSKERNNIPENGYDPATGNSSSNRKKLSDIYQEASANKMFDASLNGTPAEKSAAKDIAKKYAEAMSRTLSTGSSPSKYLISAGNAADVSQDVSGITQINASVKLTESDVNSDGKKYYVKLTDRDIVIALPVNCTINSKFRIDKSVPEANGDKVFCYFMFYNPNNTNQCFYLDSTAAGSISKVAIDVYDKDSDTFNTTDYVFTKTTATERDAFFTKLGQNGNGNPLTAELGSLPATNISDAFSGGFTDIDNNVKKRENYIIFLVPDQVDITIGENGTLVQGILFAVNSNFEIKANSGSKLYGQATCSHFTADGCQSGNDVLINVPPASDSILGYVGLKNMGTYTTEIQYYEF